MRWELISSLSPCPQLIASPVIASDCRPILQWMLNDGLVLSFFVSITHKIEHIPRDVSIVVSPLSPELNWTHPWSALQKLRSGRKRRGQYDRHKNIIRTEDADNAWIWTQGGPWECFILRERVGDLGINWHGEINQQPALESEIARK